MRTFGRNDLRRCYENKVTQSRYRDHESPLGISKIKARSTFLEAAKASAKVVHFMHSSHAQHLKSFQSVMQGTFRIPGKYMHHTSQNSETSFTCYRWEA